MVEFVPISAQNPIEPGNKPDNEPSEQNIQEESSSSRNSARELSTTTTIPEASEFPDSESVLKSSEGNNVESITHTTVAVEMAETESENGWEVVSSSETDLVDCVNPSSDSQLLKEKPFSIKWRKPSRSSSSFPVVESGVQSKSKSPLHVAPPPPSPVGIGGGSSFIDPDNFRTPRSEKHSSGSLKKLTNLNRGRLHHSLSSLQKKSKFWSRFYMEDDENIKRVLDAVKTDHEVITDPADNKNRRTLRVTRHESEKFGFTIQSYTFCKPDSGFLEQLTYVDYVELHSNAYLAGIRAGDVIMSVNGIGCRGHTHEALVNYIVSHRELRLVVLFENCVQKIDLCSRAIKLKKLLEDKEFELKMLTLQETRLCQGECLLTTDELFFLLQHRDMEGMSLRSGSMVSLPILPSDWRSDSASTHTPSVSESEIEATIDQHESAISEGASPCGNRGNRSPPFSYDVKVELGLTESRESQEDEIDNSKKEGREGASANKVPHIVDDDNPAEIFNVQETYPNPPQISQGNSEYTIQGNGENDSTYEYDTVEVEITRL